MEKEAKHVAEPTETTRWLEFLACSGLGFEVPTGKRVAA